MPSRVDEFYVPPLPDFGQSELEVLDVVEQQKPSQKRRF
jgi:hypothetical protein